MNNMDIDQVKVAIGAIALMEVSMVVMSYFNKTPMDIGTVGMGIAAIAGLAGYDMKKE